MVRALSSKYTNRSLHQTIIYGDPNNVFDEKDLDLSRLNHDRQLKDESQQYALARVIKPAGNHLFLCRLYNSIPSAEDGSLTAENSCASSENQVAADEGLVELPPKFRNFLWIKRGGFVVIELWPSSGIKIIGSIVHLVRPDQLISLRRRNILPSSNAKTDDLSEERRLCSESNENCTAYSDDNEDDDNNSLLARNPNHLPEYDSSDDDSHRGNR